MYRHIMLYKRANDLDVNTDQPHDFQGDAYEKHWPKGKGAELLIDLTQKAKKILAQQPLNQKRVKADAVRSIRLNRNVDKLIERLTENLRNAAQIELRR